MLVLLDFSIVNVALPDLTAELGVSESSAQWVVTAYALTFGGLLIVGGRASDAFGVALLGSLVGRAGTRYVDGDTAQPGADPGTGLALAAGLVVLAALVSLAAPHRGERRKRDQARRSLRAVS